MKERFLAALIGAILCAGLWTGCKDLFHDKEDSTASVPSASVPSNLSLAESLAWIKNNAVSGGNYIITLNADESLDPRSLYYSGRNVGITLNGGAAERTVSLSSTGSLFTVEIGVTLTLGNNVTLQGRSDNTSSLVLVNSYGTLVMGSGAKVSGNTVSSFDGGGYSSTDSGGGVYVLGNGTFTMSGGEISGNTANYGGGGVFVVGDGTFTMSGGEISGNTANYGGGGVYVMGSSGTFTKSGGTIYGADASDALKNTATSGYNYGHAVYVDGSPVKRRNTTADASVNLDSAVGGATGGWVDDWIESLPGGLSLAESLTWIRNNAEEGGNYIITLNADESLDPQWLYYNNRNVGITLNGGDAERTVSLSSTGSLFAVESGVTLTLGNNVTLRGRSDNTQALVHVSDGTLVMESGAKVSGNTTDSGGGGVYVGNYGTFTMSGGEISGNTSSSYDYGGGGVYVDSSGTFTKSGGTIYGADASDALKNTATSDYNYGHAVYVSSDKKRNGTADASVNLDSAISGAAGGWVESLPGGLSLAESLAWISANATTGVDYTITLNADESLAPQSLYYSGRKVGITLDGGDAERTVSLSSTGSLFTVESGVTLTLGNNVTLRGRSDNTSSLVQVNNGGTLVMESGAKVSGNTSSYSSGGVYVSSSGTFTKSGGTIYGADASDALKNTATNGYNYGHAVHVESSPAKRRNTTAGASVNLDSAVSGAAGGWVDPLPGGLSLAESLAWIRDYATTGVDYTITLNADESLAPQSLYYSNRNVGITMDGGDAERTVSLSSTGSLFTVESGVTLTLGNNVTLRGRNDNMSSLVQVNNGGTLVMESGAKVSKNTSSYGGGVYVGDYGTFTMSGGEISGNTSYYYGGGVYVGSSGTFTKSGGTIYGADASDALKNTATSDYNYGHAVYVDGSPVKRRNTTADASVNLDSAVSGAAGGWVDVSIGISNVVYSGNWALQGDGRRKSPAISHSDVTKARISFTSSGTNAFISVQLDASSESGCDFAFVSTLDNASASYSSGYYDRISGTDATTSTVIVTIPVSTAGDHFLEIGYQKDDSESGGSDCAWFKVIQ